MKPPIHIETPSNWKPTKPEDFIGVAATVAGVLALKVKKLLSGNQPLRVVFVGPPGTGKTALAEMLASMLAGHGTNIERVNGKSVGVDAVRDWMRTLGCGSLFGYSVKIINELDKCSDDAQVQLLSYADEMSSGRALIGTSNKKLGEMDKRFQTWWMNYQITNPDQEDIAGLVERFGVPPAVANQIAFGAGGCVRAALLDAEAWLDVTAFKKAA